MATPNRKATNSEARGASRAMLLKMLSGIPGLRPASIAPATRWTVPFTASETSAMGDFGIQTFMGERGQRDVITHDLISKSTNSQSIKKRELLRVAVVAVIARAAADGAPGASAIAPTQSRSRPRSTSNRADCPAPSSRSLASRHGKDHRCSHKRPWRN
jgi:hypothetical protein